MKHLPYSSWSLRCSGALIGFAGVLAACSSQGGSGNDVVTGPDSHTTPRVGSVDARDDRVGDRNEPTDARESEAEHTRVRAHQVLLEPLQDAEDAELRYSLHLRPDVLAEGVERYDIRVQLTSAGQVNAGSIRDVTDHFDAEDLRFDAAELPSEQDRLDLRPATSLRSLLGSEATVPGRHRIAFVLYDGDTSLGRLGEPVELILDENPYSDSVRFAIVSSLNLEGYDVTRLAETSEWVVRLRDPERKTPEEWRVFFAANSIEQIDLIEGSYAIDFPATMTPREVKQRLMGSADVLWEYPLVEHELVSRELVDGGTGDLR